MQENNKKCIAITGSNGFIGSNLRSYLHSYGYKVISLQRICPKDTSELTVCFEYCLEKKPDPCFLEGVDILIHCAFKPYNLKNKKSDEINIEGSRKLISICREKKIKLIFLSTLSAHNETQSHYGKNKLKIEGLFDPSQDLIFKLGLVIGNGGLYINIRNIIEKTRFIPLIDGGKQPIQTIAMDDLLQLFKLAIEKGLKGKYEIAEEKAFPIKMLYINTALQLGKKIRFIPIHSSVIMCICKIAEALGLSLPINSENVLGLKCLRAFDTKEDLRILGISLKSFDDTIKHIGT